ncbi:ABC transporter permease [Streptomyces sp. NPDC050738]|uniref:ABC transporter permease n=1 Tax=Streptomyces sp. NPDC050738 TaxID=3154744 RepID=UPI003423F68C
MTTATLRLGALARAELTLMGRNKATLSTALLLPTVMTFSMYSVVKDMDLSDTGLTVGSVLIPGALGYVLLFAVYSTLVGVFVVRREQLVLKRLRTGELRDQEILAGASFPTVAVGVVQCAIIAVAGSVAMGVEAPGAWWLALVGLVIGLVLMCALAAATAALTKSAEGAQLTIAPVLLLSMAGSGLVVPLDVMPDRLASLCELLPLTPVVGMIRSGWTGGVDGYETLGQVATALAWIVLAVFAVRKWFRWEPRR